MSNSRIEAVCQNRLRSRSSVQTLVRSHNIKSKMASIANSTCKDSVTDEAARSNWIVGYETGEEGSTATRLEKILWGLRNLTMVGDNAWENYIRGSAAIMQDAIAEDGLAKVQPELYSQEKALAEVEEAWLAVGEEARDPAAPDWPGQEVAAAYGSSLASIERLLDHMSNIATRAQPQQDYRNGSTAVGQAGGGPCALKRSLEAHGITSLTRLRGGGGTGDRRREDEFRRGTGSAGKRRMVGEPEAERKRQRRSPHEQEADYFRSATQGAEEWCRVTEEIAATKEGAGGPSSEGNETAGGARPDSSGPAALRATVYGGPSSSIARVLLAHDVTPGDCLLQTFVGSTPGHRWRSRECECRTAALASAPAEQLQPKPCTSQDGHRWLVDCRYEPPRCGAVWCGQVGCDVTIRCDCADPHIQGARDVQRRGLTEAAIERGLVEDSRRGTKKDDGESVQRRGVEAKGEDEEDTGGWDKVEDTFMEDPRWEDYIKAVKCGDNPTLTWRQYVLAQRVSAGLAGLLALGYRRQLPVVTEQSPTPSPPPAPPAPHPPPGTAHDDTFVEGPRWEDYVKAVKCGDNPTLTWRQYVLAQRVSAGLATLLALGFRRPQQLPVTTEQLLTRSPPPAPPAPHPPPLPTPPPPALALPPPAPQPLPPSLTEALSDGESSEAQERREHLRDMALLNFEAEERRLRQRERHRRAEEESYARMKRWEDNRGEAAERVPLLPKELWAMISTMERRERGQLEAWRRWADAKLMQLVVEWFRMGGQHDSRWLGSLVGEVEGSAYRMALRFTPWCRAILQPGAVNDPLLHMGRDHAPADFVNVYVHVLSMMNYLGFHDVMARLQRIMRLLMRCIHPDSGVPKYVPGPDDDEHDWEEDAPEPGQQPPCPQKSYTARA